ncbi:hypothetical protein L0P06_11340, partial [Amedibacillus dolichus]|uniref:hypothetical protein n=1 Tax=Amedibacillus dolichus TaxID=31971 RepID=UPI001EDC7930
RIPPEADQSEAADTRAGVRLIQPTNTNWLSYLLWCRELEHPTEGVDKVFLDALLLLLLLGVAPEPPPVLF